MPSQDYFNEGDIMSSSAITSGSSAVQQLLQIKVTPKVQQNPQAQPAQPPQQAPQAQQAQQGQRVGSIISVKV
jgi:hypothetical protein